MNWAEVQLNTRCQVHHGTHVDIRTTEEGTGEWCRIGDDTQIIEYIDFLWREERGLDELKCLGPLVLESMRPDRTRNGRELERTRQMVPRVD